MKLKITAVAFIVLLAATGLIYNKRLASLYADLTSNLKGVEQPKNLILNEIKRDISTPPPLRAQEESQSSALTRAGTISWTNIQRQNNGLPALVENSRLNASAQKKLDDMFKNQYFAHESPNGKNVDDLVVESGYQYKTVGENLALGNFENDRILVSAWMDSPGHRENILNSAYSEIGVAVGRGVFEGKTTWLAVQHFGKPLPNCPQPNETIATQIENNKNLLDQMLIELNNKKEDIENSNPKSGPQYESKVEDYNSLVEEYNNLLANTKNLISNYNQEVNIFNTCISK